MNVRGKVVGRKQETLGQLYECGVVQKATMIVDDRNRVVVVVVAFSMLARSLGECKIIHSLTALFFFFFFFFFFKVEISSFILIQLRFMPESAHSGSAS